MSYFFILFSLYSGYFFLWFCKYKFKCLCLQKQHIVTISGSLSHWPPFLISLHNQQCIGCFDSRQSDVTVLLGSRRLRPWPRVTSAPFGHVRLLVSSSSSFIVRWLQTPRCYCTPSRLVWLITSYVWFTWLLGDKVTKLQSLAVKKLSDNILQFLI